MKLQHKDKHINIKMTKGPWHIAWQQRFKNVEVRIGSDNHRADAVYNEKLVLEFQHSYQELRKTQERTKYYQDKGYDVMWIVDGENDVKYTELLTGRYLLYFASLQWKINCFSCCDWVYINIGDKIFRVCPANVKSYMIETHEYRTIDEFVSDPSNWTMDTQPFQCVMHMCQRGAGTGKTYEAIQLMRSDRDDFCHKRTFIYLTKIHAAKEVIYNEFVSQIKQGHLGLYLKDDTKDDHVSGKQYKVLFKNNECDETQRVFIVGTIDSFAYSLCGDKKKQNKGDFFQSIVENIRNGDVNVEKSGHSQYVHGSLLNKETLIIVDEAQDLPPSYLYMLCQIMRSTLIDVYVIGDKLQSLYFNHNVFTHFDKKENSLPFTKIIRHDYNDKKPNIVRRFHHRSLKELVNQTVHFDRFQLQPVQDICTDMDCKYAYCHERKSKCYQILTVEPSTKDEAKDRIVNRIKKLINDETNYNTYVPENFTIISPFVTNNKLVELLESAINDYWVKKFEDREYCKKVASRNAFWKSYDPKKFHAMCVLHRSEEGRPIDFTKSEHATRICSIHAVKGDGREVVFLINLNETSLKKFSGDSNNIIYESLLNVALTRQKTKLYFFLEDNGDDIWRRFAPLMDNEDHNDNPCPDLSRVVNKLKSSLFVNWVKNDDDCFQVFRDQYIKEVELPDENMRKDNIDFGHHMIRYAIIFYRLMTKLCKDKDEMDRDQFYTCVHSVIPTMDVDLCGYKKYNDYLYSHDQTRNIPVVLFGKNSSSVYHRYAGIMRDIILNIQEKTRSVKLNRYPDLCPLETLIMLYVLQFTTYGRTVAITPMMIYNVMASYELTSDDAYFHDQYGCKCSKNFHTKAKNVDKHVPYYELINRVDNIYTEFSTYTKQQCDNEKFKYNFFHRVGYAGIGLDRPFSICSDFLIIAHSDHHVVPIIIQPTLSILNINDIVIDAVFQSFIIQNQTKPTDHIDNTTNYDRFHDKKVSVCVMSVDPEACLKLRHDIDNGSIQKTITSCLQSHYQVFAPLIWRFYKHHRYLAKSGKEAVMSCIAKIEKDYKYIPSFVVDIFRDVKRWCEEGNASKVQSMFPKDLPVMPTEAFMDHYKYRLNLAISSFTSGSACLNQEIEF